MEKGREVVIGLVTDEAKQLIAELEKRRKQEREGGTPLHAAAEGHEEHLAEQRDAAKARHPLTGQFAPSSAWPGTEAHGESADGVRLLQVGDRQAPEPVQQTTVSDRFSGDHGERFVHPGTATVSHLDLAARYPLPVSTAPVQPLPHIAPISPGGNS